MSELSALTERLRELADDAQDLADDLDRPIAPRLELGDLLRRELNLDTTSCTSRFWLDGLVEDITRVVLAGYVEAVADLAANLFFLVDDDGEERVRARLLCLDCGANTAVIGEYYMVKDEVWTQAAEKDAGMLCIGCLEERLGRQLEPGDFLDIPLNHEPHRSDRLRARVLGVEEAPAA